MRYRLALAMVSIAAFLMLLAPSSTMGQGKKKKNFGDQDGSGGQGGFNPGGFGPSGFNPGGFGGQGGPGGFGGKGGKGQGGDFTMKSKKNGPGGFGPGGFGPGGFQGNADFQGPGGFGPRGGAGVNPQDYANQMAESDFAMRDRNGDGFLNMDEMPPALRADLSRWDTNRDNLISLDEYKTYFSMRQQGGGQSSSVAIIVEEDLDTRPVVMRAGKLPKELPSWFKEFDTDKDGQVALYEWRRGGKEIDEFSDWDRNNDGYITPEEALHKQRLIQLAAAGPDSETGEQPSYPMIKKQGKGGFGPGGDGFGGGKKKGGKGKSQE